MKEEWKLMTLGDIATDMYRGAGIKRDQVRDSGIPCVRYGEIYTTYNIAFDECVSHTDESLISSKKYFQKGDILFAITGESVEEIGKSIAYLGENKCLAGGDIVVMKHKQNAKYISYALSTPDAIRQKGFGKTKLKVVHTSVPSLKEITIPVPSLTEQSRIVAKLDAAFAKIDALKENAQKGLQAVKDLWQATLKEELKPKEGWETVTMGDVCELSQGLAINSQTKHLLVEKSTIPLLRIKDMKNGTQEIFVDDKNYPKNCLAMPDDMIYTRTGSLGLIFTGQYGIVHNNCFKIKVDEKNIDKSYYMYFVSNERFKDMIVGLAQRAAQPDITHKLFKAQNIDFPPLKEQKNIVERLNKFNSICENIQSKYEQELSEYETLKQSILRKAFSGEL